MEWGGLCKQMACILRDSKILANNNIIARVCIKYTEYNVHNKCTGVREYGNMFLFYVFIYK